jgi:hypothetical protein
MKKFVVIILLLVYGLSSSGMSVKVHYCCGKFDKINFSLKSQENKKNDSKKKCCDNRKVSFKLKTDQESTAKQLTAFSTQIIFPPVSCLIVPGISGRSNYIPEHSTGPPSYSSTALFIKNCSFRI